MTPNPGTNAAYAAPDLAYEATHEELISAAASLSAMVASMRAALETMSDQLEEGRRRTETLGPLRDIGEAMSHAQAVVRSTAWRQICILQLRLDRMTAALNDGAKADRSGGAQERRLSIVDVTG